MYFEDRPFFELSPRMGWWGPLFKNRIRVE